ncbi:hypothetical protein K504DRAFT_383494 [Pleomassaria siparia CBS 279.74]|uniref:Symplekin/Pta1 N-terminal domain-containing protein n=1 Tax=Pleomassaria siparia CBS 279.74 TaxID=1314801 RepID=A0A6G1K652_9PLEO|nr:hypothetical protein K504DRAFT_383494 [Pleomassaria siparia CBS 279.74]
MNPSAQTPVGQLEAARSLALGDGRYYPTIIPGVMPIIGANADASIEIRRWGADFLAETFASPTWPPDVKVPCALSVLATIKEYLEGVADSGVLRSAVQAAASIYPLVYRHIIADPADTQHWQLMLAIKSNILRRMDSAPPGVRICCVKFVQQIVLVQTPGMPPDPRRPEHTDISLALVPRDHPMIPYANLEAESSGLLDRLLGIIHGDHRLDRLMARDEIPLTMYSDALLVTATLNSLGMLIQRRPAVITKILSSVMNFNPLKLANSPMTSKNKVLMKSIERTTRALLVNVMKRNPEGPFTGRIQQYLEKIHRMRIDVLDESNRKRPAPTETTDNLDAAKRQRLDAPVPIMAPAVQAVPALPPGPVSFRQLFTLNPDGNTANFDVQAFQDPEQLLRILVPVLQSIDETRLGSSINAVRSRYLTLSTAMPRPPVQAPAAVDDEEEYEPDFEPEDAEQVMNKLDGAPPDNFIPERISDAPLAPYRLPEAPLLTVEEAQNHGKMTIQRAFQMLSSIGEPNLKTKITKGGFNRLAASSFDRDSWITILSRLATRASAGLGDIDQGIKSEFEVKRGSLGLGESIRNQLYQYIMSDWRKRIDVAISWLNEEWYNDNVIAQSTKPTSKPVANGNGAVSVTDKGNYQRCALRLLDGMLTYIEGTDKVLVRFISEIPGLDMSILSRMKKMAEDPERIDLAIMVLQYLYMFRPPVRELAVDVLVDMWRTNDRAKNNAKKLLLRWRPEALQEDREEAFKTEKESANGALEVKAA